MEILYLLIEDLHLLKNLLHRGILKLLKFTKGKKQMSSAEVDESPQIAHVRIDVERVIGRLRKFRILQSH